MKRFFLFLIFIPLYLIIASAQVSANEFAVGIYPPVIQVSATPPASIKTAIQIKNENDQEISLMISYKSFKPAGSNNGEIVYSSTDSVDGPDSLIFQKIHILEQGQEIQDVRLGAYESKLLTLDINIAKDDPLGDYYFSIIFFSNPTPDAQSSSSRIPAGIATNVILSIGPKGPTQAQINKFSTPFFLDSGPVPFTLLLENTSNHFIIATGNLVIRNLFGNKVVANIPILPQYTLANSSRFLTDAEQASPSAATLKMLNSLRLKNRVILWPESFLFGIYSADLSLVLSENGPILHSSVKFIAVPFSIIVGITIAITILLSIYLRVKRKI